MSLDRFKCIACQLIPDADVFQCRNAHFACLQCKEKMAGVCRICLRSLSIQTENPILQELNRGKVECKFKDLGCTWRFLATEMDKHTKECKFRLGPCIGKTLGVWSNCQWTGQQSQLREHITRAHPICSNSFGYFQEGCVPFHPDAMTLNLIDAFNKQFVFFFNSRSDLETVYFIIFVLGRKEDAAQYFYEFELKAPDKQYSKIKFVCECHSDTEDIKKLVDDEQCVSLNYKKIKNYLDENNINFRFIIKRKDEEKEALTKAKPTTTEKTVTAAVPKVPTVAKAAAAFMFANKGSLKQNSMRKNNSIPIIAAMASKKPNYTRQISEPIPLTPPPLPIITQRRQSPAVDPQLEPFTSINKNGVQLPDRHEEAPCMEPCINRRDRKISDCSRSFSIASDDSQITMSDRNTLKQPYKISNHNGIYLQKYPKSSISKPATKK